MQLRNVETIGGKWKYHIVDVSNARDWISYCGMPPLCGHGVLNPRDATQLLRFDPTADGVCEACVAMWQTGGLQNIG